MARAGESKTSSPLDRVRDLLAAAEVDTLYRDLYLGRAAKELQAILPEAAYRTLLARAPQIGLLVAESRRAVDRQDWAQVKALSAQAAQLRKELDEAAGQLEVGKKVYDAPAVTVDPLCPELQVMLPQQTGVGALRDAAIAALRRLAKTDVEWVKRYERRLETLTGLKIEDAVEPAGQRTATVVDLRQEAQNAAAAGNVKRLEEIAEAILQAKEKPAAAVAGAAASPVGSLAVPAEIRLPFPEAAVARAQSLGLAHIECKSASAEIGAAFTKFVEQHSWRPAVSAADATREGSSRLRDLLKGLNAAEELIEPATELALLFVIHPFITSAGTRYLLHFEPEYALVEDFPESEKVPEASELLAALGLPRRSGLSRMQIETALRASGPQVLEERLQLDAGEFRLVCLPWEVYSRVGRERAWGQQRRWTHIDGYQLVRGGQLRALVAGDVRYGGLLDLCAISPDDEREGVIARFAVVRRARMTIGQS